jgi:hypothetical protein
MLRLAILTITALILCPIASMADGFDTIGRLDGLKGTVIAEAANAELIGPPFGNIGGGLSIKIADYCFKPTGYLYDWTSGKRAALVLVDQQKNIKLALLESSLSSIKVSFVDVKQVACQ